jgi:transposase
MAVRVELREISNEEGNRLLRMIRRTSGSIVTWRRAQIVLLAAQRMPAPRIAEVVFSDPDTVREVIHNFNRDGFEALYPRYRGGRPRTFTLPQRQAIKRIALAVPTDLGQPFATWSLAKLADYLVAEEVVDDISHEGLRQLLREEGVSFQAVRSWKRSNDPPSRRRRTGCLFCQYQGSEFAQRKVGGSIWVEPVGGVVGRSRAASKVERERLADDRQERRYPGAGFREQPAINSGE